MVIVMGRGSGRGFVIIGLVGYDRIIIGLAATVWLS